MDFEEIVFPSSYDRFMLEQKIMQCWSVVDDLDDLADYIADSETFKDMEPKHVDEIVNLILGLKNVYNMKFDKTFEVFSGCVKNQHLTYHNPYK